MEQPKIRKAIFVESCCAGWPSSLAWPHQACAISSLHAQRYASVVFSIILSRNFSAGVNVAGTGYPLASRGMSRRTTVGEMGAEKATLKNAARARMREDVAFIFLCRPDQGTMLS